MNSFSRRAFLIQASLAGVAASLPLCVSQTTRRWRAAIIGSTGQGDYGHGLDMAFRDFPSVEVLAVADPDAAGRARAAERAGAQRQYADFREMLSREKADLVVIAPRWSVDHHAMGLAALEHKAHLLMEKPFTTNLREADDLLREAGRTNRRIAVAHQMRLAPVIQHLQAAIADDLIGPLVQLRSWGKQDARAGGEDMMVLGTHLFDMMRLVAGDARSCGAQVFCQGRPLARSDARAATEPIGLVAGDEIEADFEFAGGVTGTFTSRGRLRQTLGPWALELAGSKGVVRILMDIDPTVLYRQRTSASPPEIREDWVRWPSDPTVRTDGAQRGFGPANTRVVRDWLNAIEQDRDPQCSGSNAMKAVEMALAVYQAALRRERVSLPLPTREHPLA